MTTIRSSLPVTVRATQVSAPAAAAPELPNAQPAGHSAASTFTPASASAASTGSTGVTADVMKEAVDILGKTSGGDTLKKLLGQGWLPGADGEKAAEEFEKIKGSLSPEDAKKVEDAVQYGSAVAGSVQLGQMIMKSMMSQIEARTKEAMAEAASEG